MFLFVTVITYNVFGGALNLAQSINVTVMQSLLTSVF